MIACNLGPAVGTVTGRVCEPGGRLASDQPSKDPFPSTRSQLVRTIARGWVGRRRWCRGRWVAPAAPGAVALGGTERRELARYAAHASPAGMWVRLRRLGQPRLADDGSPEQVAGWLPRAVPDDAKLCGSPETVCRLLFVQAKGALTHELALHRRALRGVPRPGSRTRARGLAAASWLRWSTSPSGRPRVPTARCAARGRRSAVAQRHVGHRYPCGAIQPSGVAGGA